MWTYKPQNRQVASAFALTYRSASGPAECQVPLSSHPCLPCCWNRHKQQGPFAPQTFLCFPATADPFVTLSPFPGFPVSPVIRVSAPSISRRGEEGFSSCSAYPCHRAVATTPPECSAASVRLRRSMLPSLHDRELGLWGHAFEAPSAFTFFTAR